MQELNTLKEGDTYSHGKYRIISNDGFSIRIRRIADNHIIVFHKGSINYDWLVKKD